jgi:hypothetical protein
VGGNSAEIMVWFTTISQSTGTRRTHAVPMHLA